MSRTTYELEKAKRRVHLAALTLKADPSSVEKQVALAEAIDDLERDRDTVQGAILKALHCPAIPSAATFGAANLPAAMAKSLQHNHEQVEAMSKAVAEDRKANAKPVVVEHDMTDRVRKRAGR